VKGDFSRFTHDPSKHYTGVLKQQGRVDLDADWNEHVEIQDHLRRAMERDLMGGSGVPDKAGGFLISWAAAKKDLFISPDDSTDPTRPSCIYVDSILCELEATQVPFEKTNKNVVRVQNLVVDGLRFEEGQWVELIAEGSTDTELVQIDDVGPAEKELTLSSDVEDGFTHLRRLTTYDSQPHYPEPDALNPVNGRVDLVYLDVWQRHVTAIEDPDIREEALAGPDTTTRLQTVWQVKVRKDVLTSLPAACSPEALPQDWPPAELGGGRLSTAGSYRGSENRMYRVEIHDGGTATASSGNATFKWSRDNGTVVFPIEEPTVLQPKNKVTVSRLGRDQALALREGDWVEVGGDESELKDEPGLLAQIKEDGLNRAQREVTLDVSDVSSHAKQRSPKMRRWDQTDADDSCVFDPQRKGACKVKEGAWIELEDGVKICFAPGNPDHVYRTGDFWIFTARAATGKVEELHEAQPRGVRHHYCPLALMEWSESAGSTTAEIRDCRTRFGSLSGQLATVESFFYLGGDGQEAIPGEELLQPLRVGVVKGGTPLDGREIEFKIEKGNGRLRKVDGGFVEPYDSVTVETKSGGVAGCCWQLDTATPTQGVRATVVSGGQAPIIFTANLSLVLHGTDKPFAGTQVNGPVVFGRSGGALGSTYGGQEKLAFRWDASRNVRIGGRAPTYFPVFSTQWGSLGNGDGQFQAPRGVAVDADSNVYVADSDNHRIQKFTPDGTFITKWGSLGKGDGQFNRLQRVAVDADNNVYVADSFNHRIQKFTPDGTFITKWGSLGQDDGQFNFPRSVAVEADNNVYVADTENHRIQKFTPDGTFITKWGGLGQGDGQFNFPQGVAVDAEGDVCVADSDNHRIQKFTPDGTFITKWGIFGRFDGQFNRPLGMAVEADNNVYIADTQNHRIQRFDTSGNLNIEGSLLAVGGPHSQHSQIRMEGVSGLWRIRLDEDALFFEANTSPLKDFSSVERCLKIMRGGVLEFTRKEGYVGDYFINRSGDTVERGDVIVASTNASHYYSIDSSIPLPEATAAENAYDSRVCGIVADVVTENNLPFVEVQAPNADHVAGEVKATDGALRKAMELGVSLFDVEGTGSGGRILVADVEAAKEKGSTGGEPEPHTHPLARFAGEITAESDATKIEDQQMGTMVTVGSYAHCKVDADIAPISVGDLLTTSPTKGHAQKVLEREKAIGAIVGKALASLDRGKGMIPVLVMLQ
jgi:streptogramin lyase